MRTMLMPCAKYVHVQIIISVEKEGLGLERFCLSVRLSFPVMGIPFRHTFFEDELC